MTRDEILAMEAGPEMDALVETRVMGWQPDPHHLNDYYRDKWPAYSTNIAAAWEVVSKMSTTTKEHWDISFSSCHCIVKFWYEGGRDLPWQPGEYEADRFGCEDVPLLVCRVALLATIPTIG